MLPPSCQQALPATQRNRAHRRLFDDRVNRSLARAPRPGEPVPPEQPIAPMILPPSTSGMPPSRSDHVVKRQEIVEAATSARHSRTPPSGGDIVPPCALCARRWRSTRAGRRPSGQRPPDCRPNRRTAKSSRPAARVGLGSQRLNQDALAPCSNGRSVVPNGRLNGICGEIATAMPAAIRPYSMAVTPRSCRQQAQSQSPKLPICQSSHPFDSSPLVRPCPSPRWQRLARASRPRPGSGRSAPLSPAGRLSAKQR